MFIPKVRNRIFVFSYKLIHNNFAFSSIFLIIIDDLVDRRELINLLIINLDICLVLLKARIRLSCS